MSEEFGNFTSPSSERPTISPLDDEASAFLTEAAELARELDLGADVEALSSLFDEQRALWYETPEAKRTDPNGLIAAVGARLGELLRAELALDWTLFTDAGGTDIALVVDAERLTEGENLYLFPFDAVAGRWEPQEADGGVAAYYRGVVETVREQEHSSAD